MGSVNFASLGLSEEILKAIVKLGYEKPSTVQEKVLPLALKDKDIIVKSQTGSGKTAAFAIPICEKIEVEHNKPQVLVLTPTRELCVQVKEDITNIGRYKRIRCTALIGKEPFYHQARELKQRTHAVVGTPGRTLDHIEKGSLNLEDIRYLIIDEADEMLNMGFIETVEAIISQIPKKRTTMLFSATIPEEVEELCHKYLAEPSKVEINPEQLTTEKVEHLYYEVPEGEKFDLLNKVITVENPDSCILFCRTQENVENLYNSLNKKVPCLRLHGGMPQKERFEMMDSFKRGEVIYLVATDVAARGIDVENVTHIINYDIPMEKERYVHRIGRSGRAGKEGKAITFVTPYEGRFFTEIQEYIGFSVAKAEEPLQEAVERATPAFQRKISAPAILKAEKGAEINKDIDKLYINAGKKKKIRPGDIVGAITNIPGITAEDIGVIDILDNFSYIDILNGKGIKVLEGLKTGNIKGKAIRVSFAKK